MITFDDGTEIPTSYTGTPITANNAIITVHGDVAADPNDLALGTIPALNADDSTVIIDGAVKGSVTSSGTNGKITIGEDLTGSLDNYGGSTTVNGDLNSNLFNNGETASTIVSGDVIGAADRVSHILFHPDDNLYVTNSYPSFVASLNGAETVIKGDAVSNNHAAVIAKDNESSVIIYGNVTSAIAALEGRPLSNLRLLQNRQKARKLGLFWLSTSRM